MPSEESVVGGRAAGAVTEGLADEPWIIALLPMLARRISKPMSFSAIYKKVRNYYRG